MAVLLTIWLSALLSTFVVLPALTKDVTVVTNVGTLIGSKDDVTIDGKAMKISRFLGIPYAEPPLGMNRFRIPVPKATFQEPRIVQDYGSRCLEVLSKYQGIGSEDCLFLNIYVPEINDIESLAVMIFIHGGAFVRGTGNVMIADVLSTYGNMIVVTFNYRLSAWGFLSTEDSNSPGNYGLWDQRLAIKWVHDNIEAFGGDKSRITVFGESSGAACVIYQGMFPSNQGLFQRIITQSGSAAVNWAYTYNPKQEAIDLASVVGCNKTRTEDMINCLRDLPASDIHESLNDFSNGLFRNPPMFLPSIDNVFVTCKPADIFNLDKDNRNFRPAKDMFSSLNLLTGINSGEGGLFLSQLFGVVGDPNNFLPNKTVFDTVLVPLFVDIVYRDRVNKSNKELIKAAVIAEYTDTDDPENPTKIREQFAMMYSDSYFLAPMISTVNAHISITGDKSYVYFFNVLPSYHIHPVPSWYKKAVHADELMYLFPSTLPLGPPFDDEETDVSRQMMDMWSNFAKTGNPNQPRALAITWQSYTMANQRYLDITRNMTSFNMREKLGEDRVNFWNGNLSRLVSVDDDDCEFTAPISGGLSISAKLNNVFLSALLVIYSGKTITDKPS